MRRIRSIAAGLIFTLGSAAPTGAAEISIACGAIGREHEICRQGVARWEQRSGHKARLVSVPASATEGLAVFQQLLAAGTSDIDVLQIDVVWPGILANHLIDLKPYTGGIERDHFPALVENNTVGAKLVAMPWFADAGLLYVRKDLLDKHGRAVPVTWEELAVTAEAIQEAERRAGNSRLWGFVWQGKAYEGLACAALEWIASSGGGTVVDASGEITVKNPQAAAALRRAAGWVGRITPTGVLNYSEEESRGVFQSGNAVFMRNWPYAWPLAQGEDSPVRGKIMVTRLPKGGAEGRHAGTLGGQQLAVSRYSRHPEVAADLVMFLTGVEEQKRRALAGGYNPTIRSLYEDAEVRAVAPFLTELFEIFDNAVARPSSVTGRDYNKVSSAFFNAVHNVLSGADSVEASLEDLEWRLKRIRRRGWSR